MTVLQRYFAKEIMRAVLFVLIAFLALFSFFDLIGELKTVGKDGYLWHHAFAFVMMRIPTYAYELLPIAVLIGAIYALARFAASSEFTIMRVSSMSTAQAGIMLGKIGLVFVIATMLIGEVVSPFTTTMAEKFKLDVKGDALKKEFRTGMWTKDTIREGGINGAAIGTRFLNIRELRPDGQLRGIKLYEFDKDLRLTTIITAKSADYQANNVWRLNRVTETVLKKGASVSNLPEGGFAEAISSKKIEGRKLVSEITPSLLSVLFAKPERMSAYDLMIYKSYLAENNQDTTRYDIAFWKKMLYPFSVFVMMALALPFGYLHFRTGGVSLKIFTGVMIGVGFILLNNLFSHLGLLNTWPAFVTAALPSGIFLLFAVGALWWAERH